MAQASVAPQVGALTDQADSAEKKMQKQKNPVEEQEENQAADKNAQDKPCDIDESLYKLDEKQLEKARAIQASFAGNKFKTRGPLLQLMRAWRLFVLRLREQGRG